MAILPHPHENPVAQENLDQPAYAADIRELCERSYMHRIKVCQWPTLEITAPKVRCGLLGPKPGAELRMMHSGLPQKHTVQGQERSSSPCSCGINAADAACVGIHGLECNCPCLCRFVASLCATVWRLM